VSDLFPQRILAPGAILPETTILHVVNFALPIV
jgi:hypothetical protein